MSKKNKNNANDKKEKIDDIMMSRTYFFNPKKAGKNKKYIFQHTFNEPEGVFEYFIKIENNICSIHEGRAENPYLEIISDFETFDAIAGGYISGKEAIKEGKFIIKGGIIKFITKYMKIFSGNTNTKIPENRYIGAYNIESIKNVLVLSCSPRAEKGTTHFFVEKLIEGMKNAGAKVDVLFPAKMKINPCKGCFNCWFKEGLECVFKDDMKIFWEKYNKCDLVVWATPIYIYSSTTAMKTIQDRMFVRSDPHIVIINGKETHPRKVKHMPLSVLLAVSGFNDRSVFYPLKEIFNQMCTRSGYKLIAEIFRTTSMPFIFEDFKNKIKDDIINAFIKAGEEIIKNKCISKKTKKIMDKELFSFPELISGSYYSMDKMLKEKKLPFIRN